MDRAIIVIDANNNNRASISIDPFEIDPRSFRSYDNGRVRIADGRDETLCRVVATAEEINAETVDQTDMTVVWASNMRPVRAICVHCGDIEDVNVMITEDDGLSCAVCAE